MPWMIIAKKEYVENVRNAWIIAVSILFFVFVLAASGFASLANFSAEGIGLTNITATILAMQSITDFLLPILALMLGFATLAGERESGSLGLLVAQPLTRADILLGKAVGLWGVLATALVAGIGAGGLFVIARTGGDAAALAAFVTFLLVTLAWGAAWISITVLLSAFFQRRGTAIAGSIAVWFLFGVVWTLLVLLLVVATIGTRAMMSGGAPDVPGWLIATQLLNPNSVYDGLLITTMEGYESVVGALGQQFLPEFYKAPLFAVAMLAWIALPYLGAYALFVKRDV